MWFRNLQLYRLGQRFDLSPETLDKRLLKQAFRTCNPGETATAGWVPPLGRNGRQLVHAANGRIMVCARRAEKIIPASVVRQLLDDRVAEIEAAESRDVHRREKNRMKDDIMVDLLPRALTRITNQYAYIYTAIDLFVVDSASATRAEALISLLRDALGNLAASPVQVKHSGRDIMTRWLDGKSMPAGFELGEDCELMHPDPEGGVISCKRQDLSAAEIRNHIKNGKYAVKLGIQWKQRLSCILHEDLSIKRLRFEDVITDEVDDTSADDPATRFDLDFSLMTLELSDFLPAMLHALGGEHRS
ncbi:MAG: recombination-associated protein RdgC [Thiogranum sp.]